MRGAGRRLCTSHTVEESALRTTGLRVGKALLVPLALASTPARPGPEPAHALDNSVSLTIDNDEFVGDDRHYTSGLQLAFSVDTASLPDLIRSAPPIRWSAEPQFTFAIGQRIYTPADTTRVDPDPLDRPYAGWLYALVDVRIRTGRAVDSMQASIGVIGPASLAEQTQDFYHDLVGAAEARGWDAQLDGEITLLLGYERAWPSILRSARSVLEVDLTPRVGATLGNALTYANSGMVLRVGQNLPDDFPATDISLGPAHSYRASRGTRFGWYVWFGVDARLVGWNAFLDGTSEHGPSVEREPFNYDLQAGVAAVWSRARMGFTYVMRSDEFEGQSKPDEFGQLTVSFAF